MTIYINGMPAVPQSRTTIEYTRENPLFRGREGYTLNITFPLDIRQNLAIFGRIGRLDADKARLCLPCEIHSKGISLCGSVLVTAISDGAVTCQYADGRCEQTITDELDEVIINELDLGRPPTINPSDTTPEEAWDPTAREEPIVALPWCNNAHPLVENNWVDASGHWTANVASPLSWQPQLIWIARKIAEATGYGVDFTAWENSVYASLIICNTLPAAWGEGWASLLPSWTVTEFFEQLGLLLLGEFDFDRIGKTITFNFSQELVREAGNVEIDKPLDAYDVEITDGEKCDYISSKRVVYKKTSHHLQGIYDCGWFVDANKEAAVEFGTFEEMAEAVGKHPTNTTRCGYAYGLVDESLRGRCKYYLPKLMRVRDSGRYYILAYSHSEEYAYDGLQGEETGKAAHYQLREVNPFGCDAGKDAQEEELGLVPACIDEANGQPMLYLSPGDLGDATADQRDEAGTEDCRSAAEKQIEAGEESKKEFFTEIYVAFWTGPDRHIDYKPCPIVNNEQIIGGWRLARLGLPDLRPTSPERTWANRVYKIKASSKHKISFISQSLPHPRAIYHIGGKAFVCEKLTATIGEEGMSELIKGEFYEIDFGNFP